MISSCNFFSSAANFIGNPDAATKDTSIPQVVQPLSGHPVTDVAVGCEFVIALDRDQSLWTWGTNSEGQLGIGTNEPHYTPCFVNIVRDKKLTRVSAGECSNFSVLLVFVYVIRTIFAHF